MVKTTADLNVRFKMEVSDKHNTYSRVERKTLVFSSNNFLNVSIKLYFRKLYFSQIVYKCQTDNANLCIDSEGYL